MNINSPRNTPHHLKKEPWFDEIPLWNWNSLDQIINLKEVEEIWAQSLEKILSYLPNNGQDIRNILVLKLKPHFNETRNPIHKAEAWRWRHQDSNGNFHFLPQITINPKKISSKEEFSDIFFHEICHLVYDYRIFNHWMKEQKPTKEEVSQCLENLTENLNRDQNFHFKTEFFARVVTADQLHSQGLNNNRIREATGTHWISGLSEAYNKSIEAAKKFTSIKIRLYNLLLNEYGGDRNKSQNNQLSSEANENFNQFIWALLKYTIKPDTSIEQAEKLLDRADRAVKISNSRSDFITKFNQREIN